MQELQTTLTVYKNEGETPLECLDRLRVEHPEYKDAVLSYAGRLDPMAEGLLLVLVNEENKKRAEYLGLDKEYEVDILFGVQTDTGDILGKVENVYMGIVPRDLGNVFNSFLGKTSQPYPPYSSKTVGGKPLFQWAREDKLDEIKIPKKEVEIYSISFLDAYELTEKEIREKAEERLIKVKGDFRQQDIIESWKQFLSDRSDQEFHLIRIKVSCSSGTYMRSLAENIALKLGTVGLAWKIKRTALLFGGY